MSLAQGYADTTVQLPGTSLGKPSMDRNTTGAEPGTKNHIEQSFENFSRTIHQVVVLFPIGVSQRDSPKESFGPLELWTK